MSKIYSIAPYTRVDTESQNHRILEATLTEKNEISPETVEALRQGNAEAYKTVYMRFYEPLADFLSALIHNPAEGEELAQETLVQLWEKRQNLNPQANLSGYIYTIGRNAALQYLRHQKVKLNYVNDYAAWADTAAGGDQIILARETELLIRMKLEQLPEQKRRIYQMHRQEGKTYEDIARELGISVNTVKYHMKSILSELRDVVTLFLTLLLLTE